MFIRNKKTIFATLAITFILGMAIGHMAQADPISDALNYDMKFTPNVTIPGTSFGSTVVITPNSLGEYIVALYSYGSGLAGAVAMLMLVLAGWQWLMAGGSADKISKAKNTIQNAMIGLFLLFGGYLLLSQISVRLVNFGSLSLDPIDIIPSEDQYCKKNYFPVTCGELVPYVDEVVGGRKIQCIGSACGAGTTCVDSETTEACGGAITTGDKSQDCSCLPSTCNTVTTCSGYKIADLCNANACVGGVGEDCGWDYDDRKCVKLEDLRCGRTSQCDLDGTGKWCCKDINKRRDYCRLRTEGDCKS